MKQNTWAKIAGVALALGCYTLAGTVLEGTAVATEVSMLGTFLLGWLGFKRPSDITAED